MNVPQLLLAMNDDKLSRFIGVARTSGSTPVVSVPGDIAALQKIRRGEDPNG